MPRPPRPCIECGTLSPTTRCTACHHKHQRTTAKPKPPRAHYAGDYRKRAAQVRATATHCWICGQTARPNDPWQADHLNPGDPNSPLLPAHRSCNAARGNRPHR